VRDACLFSIMSWPKFTKLEKYRNIQTYCKNGTSNTKF